MTKIKIDGEIIKIGDTVGFKADREDYGKLLKIKGRELIIETYDEYSGEPKKVYMDKTRCWKG